MQPGSVFIRCGNMNCKWNRPSGARRSHEVSAVTTLLFVAVPMVQVIFGVFPFAPNRWFGVGFAAYYCIATPLLYKACTLIVTRQCPLLHLQAMVVC